MESVRVVVTILPVAFAVACAGEAEREEYDLRSDESMVEELDESLFTTDAARDLDHDYLRDDAEDLLAARFSPDVALDSREKSNSYREAEPVVYYQVSPDRSSCIGDGCSGDVSRVRIKWSFTYRYDGGYLYDENEWTSWCVWDSHEGDSGQMSWILESTDGGRVWSLAEVEGYEGGERYPLELVDGHPRLYLSASKHHFYTRAFTNMHMPTTSGDCHDSADGLGVDGEGLGNGIVNLSSNYQRRPGHAGPYHNNVGEPGHHAPNRFVNCMYEFPLGPDDAWPGAPECGGKYFSAWGEAFYDEKEDSWPKNLWMQHTTREYLTYRARAMTHVAAGARADNGSLP